jgi:hypothetical protein
VAIKRKDSTAIINSLYGGVVPNRGLEHILVGRTEEAKQILNDLTDVKNGDSVIKFFIGPFGSGKSFIQALIQQIAYKEKFVVAKADFTPERRLYGNERKSVATYTELMKNLSIPSSPDGGALPKILDKWISDIQGNIASNKGFQLSDVENPEFVKSVENEIFRVTSNMDDMVGGYDFARILSLYYKGFVNGDTDLQRCVIRWIRGEYTTKTEAKNDLGVRVIIDDLNYYDYIKLMAKFIRQVGYAGLVINLDEAINLYKISHSQTRDKNYETILKMYNDTLQGNSEGLYITFGGTPEFLENERRGLFSYAALKSRLQSNKFESNEYRDLSQPVIKLTPLKAEETYVLLRKISTIHALHHSYKENIGDDEISRFIKKEYERPGANENLTTRDIVRTFIGGLNILHQNPDFNPSEVFGEKESEDEKPKTKDINRLSRFKSSKE